MNAQRGLYIVYLTVFIDLLGFGIILPALPHYATTFGASGLGVGALMTAYSGAQLLGAPILGRLSDRVGRRPILMLSLAGSAVAFTMSGFANSFELLLASRTIAGLAGGSIATAQAFIADVTKPVERAKYMGMLGASIGMGFVLGPAIGAGLAPYGFGAASLAAAALAAINYVFAYFVLPETRVAGTAQSARGLLSVSALFQALSAPRLGIVLVASFLAMLGFVSMESTFALLGEQRFDLTPRGLGGVFTFVGIVMVVVQGGLVGRLTKRLGERAVALLGSVFFVAGMLAVPFAPTLYLLFWALAALAAGQGLLSPSLSSLTSRLTSADQQGGILGVSQSLGAGARAVGPLIAGWLYDRTTSGPYFWGALLGLLAALLLLQMRSAPTEPSADEV